MVQFIKYYSCSCTNKYIIVGTMIQNNISLYIILWQLNHYFSILYKLYRTTLLFCIIPWSFHEIWMSLVQIKKKTYSYYVISSNISITWHINEKVGHIITKDKKYLKLDGGIIKFTYIVNLPYIWYIKIIFLDISFLGRLTRECIAKTSCVHIYQYST